MGIYMRLCLSLGLGLILSVLSGTASAQDRYFDSKGVQIRYTDQGSGEPIVLLHGYTSSIERGWVDTGVLPNLARDHRVIAFDLRGHGKSGKPRGPAAYGQEMAQDVVRLLEHLRLPRAHIVGYSLGAIITAKLLTTNPERFITATLSGHSGVRAWTSENEAAAQLAADEMVQGVPFRQLILTIAPTDEPRPREEAIRQRSEQLAAVNDPLALAAFNRQRHELVESNAEMASSRVPLLGIVGSADASIVGMRELKTINPALQLVVLEGAVHSTANMRGAPRSPEFSNAIRTFVAANRGQGGK
jgi:pimeloyl-ACP methyl ester carboxylesterase